MESLCAHCGHAEPDAFELIEVNALHDDFVCPSCTLAFCGPGQELHPLRFRAGAGMARRCSARPHRGTAVRAMRPHRGATRCARRPV